MELDNIFRINHTNEI